MAVRRAISRLLQFALGLLHNVRFVFSSSYTAQRQQTTKREKDVRYNTKTKLSTADDARQLEAVNIHMRVLLTKPTRATR